LHAHTKYKHKARYGKIKLRNTKTKKYKLKIKTPHNASRCQVYLSDTDNIVPFENTTPINMIND